MTKLTVVCRNFVNTPQTPTVARPVSRGPVTAEVRVHSQANLRGIYVDQKVKITPLYRH